MVEVDSMDTFRDLGRSVREQLGSGIAWLGAVIDGKGALLCTVSEDCVENGLHAGDLVNAVAELAKGRGGGKAHMAQAGIKAIEQLPNALQKAPEVARAKLA